MEVHGINISSYLHILCHDPQLHFLTEPVKHVHIYTEVRSLCRYCYQLIKLFAVESKYLYNIMTFFVVDMKLSSYDYGSVMVS